MLSAVFLLHPAVYGLSQIANGLNILMYKTLHPDEAQIQVFMSQDIPQ